MKASQVVTQIRESRARDDSWAQVWSTRDHITGLIFALEVLSELYDQNWLAQRVVDKLPEEALRPAWRIEDDDEGELRKQFDALDTSPWQADGHFLDALKKGRLHGGSAILLGYDSDPAAPAPPLGEGKLLWLDIARRDELAQSEIESDANSPNFGQTSQFVLTGFHRRRGMKIHSSRTILCEGKTFQSRYLFTYSQGYRFPWVSVLQPVNQLINAFGESWISIAHLLKEMSIMFIKQRGFVRAATADDATDLETRLSMMNMYKSIYRTLFLDAGDGKGNPAEEVGRTDVKFTDMPALMAEWAKLVAAAADMPVTVLMGISPAGMNATGESDLTLWYDRVKSYRQRSIKPKLERICSVLAGREVVIDFDPIWEPSALVQAQTRLANAQADQSYYTTGGLTGLETVVARIKDGTLGLDVDLEEKEKQLEAERNAPTEPPPTGPNGETGPNAKASSGVSASIEGTGGQPGRDQPLDESLSSGPGARPPSSARGA